MSACSLANAPVDLFVDVVAREELLFVEPATNASTLKRVVEAHTKHDTA
jgi:hypothetical protein